MMKCGLQWTSLSGLAGRPVAIFLLSGMNDNLPLKRHALCRERLVAEINILSDVSAERGLSPASFFRSFLACQIDSGE
jgi:hypothetical protein